MQRHFNHSSMPWKGMVKKMSKHPSVILRTNEKTHTGRRNLCKYCKTKTKTTWEENLGASVGIWDPITVGEIHHKEDCPTHKDHIDWFLEIEAKLNEILKVHGK